jgi:hypothetical protein
MRVKHSIVACVLPGLLFAANEKSSSFNPKVQKGIFIGKIAFSSQHPSQGLPPMLTVADL